MVFNYSNLTVSGRIVAPRCRKMKWKHAVNSRKSGVSLTKSERGAFASMAACNGNQQLPSRVVAAFGNITKGDQPLPRDLLLETPHSKRYTKLPYSGAGACRLQKDE
jgi:hypothetical protein